MTRVARDRGFTLVELIVVISIMAVLTSSVGAALFLGFKTTTNTYSRLDQSNAAMSINRFLTGDLLVAEGPVVINSATDMTCGGVAPLKLWSRSNIAGGARDTVTVWARSGTDLVRRTCVNGAQIKSSIVAKGIEVFTPAACAAPCTSPTVSVTYSAAGSGKIAGQSWTLTVRRRGATT
jgi:prepilin-type N-terminal cleavage/methylation domain-containing protein